MVALDISHFGKIWREEYGLVINSQSFRERMAGSCSQKVTSWLDPEMHSSLAICCHSPHLAIITSGTLLSIGQADASAQPRQSNQQCNPFFRPSSSDRSSSSPPHAVASFPTRAADTRRCPSIIMIDELINYCIEEIGLDGEAGTEIERLADFIRQFHAEHSSRSHLPTQLVDASYQAFVFRQLLGHPDVRVGLFVAGVPIKSGTRGGITKRKASGLDSPAEAYTESHPEASPEFDWVDVLPDQALAEQQGLFQLQSQHGDLLRLVLQPSVIKRLLVGANDILLPPSAYRVLQIICRSREKPVLSMHIGTAMHTDQKTVFYLCKRLIDLGLVTKIKARETGTVASYFLATKFEDRCEILIQQRNADITADIQDSDINDQDLPSSSALHYHSRGQFDTAQDSEEDADAEVEADDEEQDASAPTVTVKEEAERDNAFLSNAADSFGDNAEASTSAQTSAPVFEYIDEEKSLLWIKSRPELVRLRIYLLCNQTESKVTQRIGLVRRINIARSQLLKRAFVSMLEHAVVDGFLEVIKIYVASTLRTHRGLRMTPSGYNEMQELLNGQFAGAASLQDQIKANRINMQLQQDLARVDSSLPRELTLERFVYEHVAQAGPSGRTLNQLVALLHGTGHFSRAIEQIILRAEEADGESSMSDLRVRCFHEHKLRIRNVKLYSHHAWVLQCANEGYLDQQDIDLLAAAGGPSSFHRKSIAWTAPQQAVEKLMSLSKDLFTPTPRKGGARLGRPPKRRNSDDEFDTPAPKRGRPRKPRAETDPDAPPPKRGRPRKQPVEADPNTPPPKRGRPRKDPVEADPTTPTPKRGRKRKGPIDSTEASPAEAGAEPETSTSRLEDPAVHDEQPKETPLRITRSATGSRSRRSVMFEDENQDAVPKSPSVSVATRRSRRLVQDATPSKPTSRLASSPITAETAGPLQTEEAVRPESPATPTPPVQSEAEQVGDKISEQGNEHVIRPVDEPVGVHVVEPVDERDGNQVDEQVAEQADGQADGQADEQGQEPANPDESQKEAEPIPATTTSADLSRVEDLLAAPAQVKAEPQATTPAKSRVGRVGRRTAAKATATPASERKTRNLTQLRMLQSLVQCLREAGGAMDTLSIPQQLTDFVERHGFASDAQLANLRDRKVREKALSAAVNNGMLRRTYVKLDNPSSAFSRRQIVYLPELPADQLHAYCEAVRTGRGGWTDTKKAKTVLMTATDHVEVGHVDGVQISKPWHTHEVLRLADVPRDPSQLHMLRQPFRDITSVYRQYLGFLGGELLRLKAFHHACARYISARAPSPTEPAALPLSFFWTEAPLDLYLGLVPTPLMLESTETMVLNPQIRSLPVQDLPLDLKAGLGLLANAPNEAHIALYSLATQLRDLGIARLHVTAEDSDATHDMLTTTVEPLHRIPSYDFYSDQPEKPLTGVSEVGLDADQINLFWAKTQACCLNMRKGVQGTNEQRTNGEAQDEATMGGVAANTMDANALNDVDLYKTLPEELASILRLGKSWRPYHQLRPSQQKFLQRIDVNDIPTASQDDIDRLAYITLAPQQVIRAVFEHQLECAREPLDPDTLLPRQKKPRFNWPLKLTTISLPTNGYKPVETEPIERGEKTQADRERQGRLTTMTKARELRQRREDQFQALLDHAFSESPAAHDLRGKIEKALTVIRKKFAGGDVRFDADAAQKAIQRAIRSASGIRLMPAVRAPTASRSQRRARPASVEQEEEAEEHPDQPEPDQEADDDGGVEAQALFGPRPRAKRDRRSRRNTDGGHFWNPARKELLRDAAVILRVRDQVRGRSDWSALLQIVDQEERIKTKSNIMGNWRNQYYRMRSLHGEEAYLSALESRWIPVYLEARAEGLLKDPDFPAATGFDLVAQIEVLRARIDKNEVQRSLTRPVARNHLPLDLKKDSDFTKSWKTEFEEDPVERRFEAFFGGELGVTTKRLDAVLSTALGQEAAVSGEVAHDDIAKLMAEWAVRIVIASSASDFETRASRGESAGVAQAEHAPVDETVKAAFCRTIGDKGIEIAMHRLLEAKLIRSISADPAVRRRPGTNFVFTEELQKLIPDAPSRNRLAAEDLQATLTHRREASKQSVMLRTDCWSSQRKPTERQQRCCR